MARPVKATQGMKQRPPLASGGGLQNLRPIRPDGFVPRFAGQGFACHRQELGLLDDRRDLAIDNSPPVNHIDECGKIAARGKPKGFRLVAGDIIRLEPTRTASKLNPCSVRADSAASSAGSNRATVRESFARSREAASSSRLSTGCSATEDPIKTAAAAAASDTNSKITQCADRQRAGTFRERFAARRRQNVVMREAREPARPGQNLEKLHLHRSIGHMVFTRMIWVIFCSMSSTTDGNVLRDKFHPRAAAPGRTGRRNRYGSRRARDRASARFRGRV